MRSLSVMAAALGMLAMTACMSELESSQGQAKGGDGHMVTFSLGKARLTRAAASVNGFDRERTIDADKLYVVVFNSETRQWVKTIAPSAITYTEADGSCSFDMGEGGVYYVYFVANTTDASKLTAIADADSDGDTDEEDFLKIVDQTAVGDNGATSTGFLMVSGRTLCNINAAEDNATSLGNVTMTRRAARIDIDGSAITGLKIKQVTVNKRYKAQTLLVRAGSDTDPSGTSVQTEYITTGTAGENQILVSATTNDALVSDQQWQGVIYGYENPATNTEVTVLCELDGFELTAVAKFAEATGGAKALKANTLYTIALSKSGDSSDPANQLQANIEVTDWTQDALTYTDMTDTATPSFSVTSGGTANADTNPSIVRVKKTQDNSVVLKVTSGGVVGSEVYVVEAKDASLQDFAFGQSNIVLNATPTYENGKIVQTVNVSVSQTIAESLGTNGYIKLRVVNAFDEDYYQEFQIKAGYAMTATLNGSSWTYTGSDLKPTLATLVVTDDNSVEHDILSNTTDYTVTYSNNVNAGTGTVTIETKTGTTYEGASTTVNFTIDKATPTLTLSPTSLSVKFDGSASATKTITATLSHGELDGQQPTFSWDAGTYATVSAAEFNNSHQAVITIQGQAEQKTAQTLTVTAAETDNYNSVSATCAIKVVNGVDAAALNLGDIIYDDGDVTAGNAYNSSKHAIGVVVYKAASAEAACETNVDAGHGTVAGRVLVMSLQDVSGTKAWFTANSTDHSNFTNVNNNTSTAQSDFGGYAKTKQMATKTGECASHTHDAAVAAWSYTPAVATSNDYLEGSTGWFLPSIGQWMKVANAMGVSSIPSAGSWSGNGSVATTLSNYITAAGGNASTLVGSDYYWSSSEYSDTNAQSVRWYTGGTSGFTWHNYNKTSTFYVRPFLAY